jgi:hypothetical protein
MYQYWFRPPTWLDGVLVGLLLGLLVGPLWYALLVFGDLAALVQGNPLGISLAPLTGLLRGLLVGVALAAEVLLPVSLYMDARKLAAAERTWQPHPGTFALGGLLFPLSLVVALYYLLRRAVTAFGAVEV